MPWLWKVYLTEDQYEKAAKKLSLTTINVDSVGYEVVKNKVIIYTWNKKHIHISISFLREQFK